MRRRVSDLDRAYLADKQRDVTGAVICGLCPRPITGACRTEIDHILPLCLGGVDDIENMQIVHAKCHRKKTDTDVRAKSKADRQGGATGQKARRFRGTTQRIPSRPFNRW